MLVLFKFPFPLIFWEINENDSKYSGVSRFKSIQIVNLNGHIDFIIMAIQLTHTSYACTQNLLQYTNTVPSTGTDWLISNDKRRVERTWRANETNERTEWKRELIKEEFTRVHILAQPAHVAAEHIHNSAHYIAAICTIILIICT